MTASCPKPSRSPGFLSNRPVVFAVALSALLAGLSISREQDPPAWNGTVVVPPGTLRIEPGKSAGDSATLSEPPADNPGFLEAVVNGSDASPVSMAPGDSGRLPAGGTAKAEPKGEGAMARLDVGSVEEGFGKADADLPRLGLEAGRDYSLFSGDGDGGAGVEPGAGLRYRHPLAGWTAQGRGRWLVTHGGALKREQGFRARFGLDAGVPGLGPWANVTWTLDDAGSGTRELWEPLPRDPTGRRVQVSRVDLRLGYSIAAGGNRGVLTPYGKVSVEDRGARSRGVGIRLSTGWKMTVHMEAERREPAAGESSKRYMVGLTAAF